MAKFCVHCGRPLQEGEVCPCQKQAAQQQQTPVPAAPSGAAIYVKQLWSLIKRIFQAPSSMLKSFAASADSNTALGLIVVHALAFALFMLTLFGRIGASIASIADKASSEFGNNVQLQEMIKFPLAKIFFLSLFLSFGVACLFAAILLFFNKTVFKADSTYKHMLCVSGGSGIASVPFLLVGILALLLNLKFGLCVASFGVILQLIFTFNALKGTSQISENKSAYVLFLSFAVLQIAILIIIRIFYPMYLPDALVSALKQLKSGFDFFSLLGSFSKYLY